MVLWRELTSWSVSEREARIKSLKSAVSQISKRLQSRGSPSLAPLLVARFKWALVNAGCIALVSLFVYAFPCPNGSSANILDVTDLSLCPPMCICMSRVRPQSSRIRLLKVLNIRKTACCFSRFSCFVGGKAGKAPRQKAAIKSPSRS